MTPSEQAAVQAAVRAVWAHARQSGHRTRASRSAADVLDERLELDWSRFDSRAYKLLREVHDRVSGLSAPKGGVPDAPRDRGAKYEKRYSPARRRLARATTA